MTLVDREIGRFRETVADALEEFKASVEKPTFVGAEPGAPLEHVTRRHFIDRFLGRDGLGWDMSRVNEEIVEEARTRGEATLRLDYLGVNPQTRAPVLIVEAKAWNAPPVAASEKYIQDNRRPSSVSLICAAINHFKANGKLEDAPVIGEWAKYLDKLRQYVQSVHAESGHVVKRVATLSGQWLVIFKDPTAIFVTPGNVDELLIDVYSGDELVTNATKIFRDLARSYLSHSFPETLRPSLATAYIDRSHIKNAYRAICVSRQTTGFSWRPKPNLDLSAAIVLERKDGAVLTVVDDSASPVSLPHDYGEIVDHIAAVAKLSDDLFNRLNRELHVDLVPASVDCFPGFSSAEALMGERLSLQVPGAKLMKPMNGRGQYLVVTGTARHFLQGSPSVNPCAGHDWSYCQAHNEQQPSKPIVSRSVDPKAFFISREGHHCAHRVVHDRRANRCQIDAFEEYLCCRACEFQAYCWSAEQLAALPCGVADQGASASAEHNLGAR